MKLSIYTKLALVVGVCAFLASPLEAAVNYYHISINTSSLTSNPGAPFSLDFQLNGGGPLSNTATVTNFDFGGGSVDSGAFPVTFGLASGSIGSSLSLTANSSSAFNELYQEFIPGSVLQFDVAITNNVNAPTPDAFSFSILDQNLESIPTNGLGNSLLMVDVSSPIPVAQTFSSAAGVAAAVPEPGTLLFGFALLGACGVAGRRRVC
ncbi:MAG: sorting protein [Chthoniobacteraceae bacterium]|nr:sorting protein [Chthoniobacteraceae bacterium]